MESASIESANIALKGLLLINGGACVAILGFLASTMSDPTNLDKAKLTYAFIHSLLYFGSGTGLAVGASCIAYFCNSAYANALLEETYSWKWRIGQILNWLGVFSGGSAFVAFWWGLLSIYRVYF